MDKESELENKLNSTDLDDKTIWQKVKDWYFEPKSFEKGGKLYKSLGIKTFKKLCTIRIIVHPKKKLLTE